MSALKLRKRVLALGGVIGLALTIAVFAVIERQSQARLQALSEGLEAALAEARDAPARPELLPFTAEGNATERYLRAEWLLAGEVARRPSEPPPPELFAAIQAHRASFASLRDALRSRLSKPSVELAEPEARALAALAPVLEELRAAPQMRRCDWPRLPWRLDAYGAPERRLAWQLLALALVGDASDPRASGALLLALSRDLSLRPGLAGLMDAITVGALGWRLLLRVEGAPDELEACLAQADAAATLEPGRALADEVLAQEVVFASCSGFSGPRAAEAMAELGMSAPRASSWSLAEGWESLRSFSIACRNDLQRRPVERKEARRVTRERFIDSPGLELIVTSHDTWRLARLAEGAAMLRAACRLRLACRLYEAREGRLPETVSELEPWLEDDPTAGLPLVFERGEDRIRLSSPRDERFVITIKPR